MTESIRGSRNKVSATLVTKNGRQFRLVSTHNASGLFIRDYNKDGTLNLKSIRVGELISDDMVDVLCDSYGQDIEYKTKLQKAI